MKKLKLKLPQLAKTEITFGEQKIEVCTFIGREDMAVILSAMAESKDSNPAVRLIENEGGLILATLDKMTNISLDKLDIDELVASGLWDKIKSSITNFNELFSDMEKIQKIETMESKLNRVIDKVEKLLDSVSNLDLSKDGIAQLLGEFDKAKGQLSEVFPTVVANAPAQSSRTTE